MKAGARNSRDPGAALTGGSGKRKVWAPTGSWGSVGSATTSVTSTATPAADGWAAAETGPLGLPQCSRTSLAPALTQVA